MKLFSTVGVAGLVLMALSSMCMAAYSEITVEQLDKAIPDRAGANSCASTDTPDECATNAAAAKAISAAMSKYKVTSRGELVALISLMAFESSDWQYNTNHFPGRPGQGTRAMLMYNFIYEYAKYLYPSKVQSNVVASQNTAVMNNVRSIVLNDNDSFGSAFWYLANVAPAFHNKPDKLRDGNVDDVVDYITNGVKTTWTPDREEVWRRVNDAL
ncbi:hypothetical protein GGF46_004298 [Coemansia sp. RSA 552]|nr:hypothetical protein GGF46_004298 [Coemansia sp. RSA 552]